MLCVEDTESQLVVRSTSLKSELEYSVDEIPPEERLLLYLKDQGIEVTPEMEQFILAPPPEEIQAQAREKLLRELGDRSLERSEGSSDYLMQDNSKIVKKEQ